MNHYFLYVISLLFVLLLSIGDMGMGSAKKFRKTQFLAIHIQRVSEILDPQSTLIWASKISSVKN